MMKKFTLFLVTMVLSMVSALSSFAQEPAAPKFSPVATDGQTVQYLYNVDTHTFLLGANDWNTRASVSVEKGYKFKVATNGNGTYTLNDFVENQNAWKAVFADNPTGIWVDNLGGANVKGWVITEAGSNLYKITNPGAGAGELAVVQDLSDTRLYLRESNPGAYAATWAFVSEADYADYMASYNAAAVNAWATAKKDQVNEALKEVIRAAQKVSLDAMGELVNGTNIYGEGYADYAAKYTNYMEQWEAGTLTETVVNPSATTSWHGSTAYNFLLTPWTIGGEKANNFDKALYINTWSTEGANDGTNFTVPFFEYFVGGSKSLAANVISTKVTGLVPGKSYTVSAWVRAYVREDNDANTAYGISFQAGDGEAIDVCAGERVGTSRFRIMNAVATGVADEEGNLVVKFNVVADNNICWLSFKNVYYAEAVDPMTTSTSLMLGEDEVAINDHSAVSVENADAIKVQVENEPSAIGFSYAINAMVLNEDEEGQFWTVGAELAVGEGNFNGGMGYAQFENGTINFEEGNKYQVSVTVMGGNPADPAELATYTYEINGSYAAPMATSTSLMLGEDEVAINDHSAVSVENADAIKVQVEYEPSVIGFTYAINAMDLKEDGEGQFWTVGAELAVGEGNFNGGMGYAQFENGTINFEEGNKYQVSVTVMGGNPEEPAQLAAYTYEINGSYTDPMEVETALVLGEEEIAINDHSEVTVDAADAIKVNVMNAPQAVGFSYAINAMKEVTSDEGTTWVADESYDIAVGEGTFNTIGFVSFDDVVYFEQGSKYQVKVTVYGGNPAEPTEVGFYTYVINGSHAIEPEIAASLVSGEEEIALNSHSAVSVETADAVSVAFDGVIPTSASYKVNSLIEVLGEESSTWEVNETIAEGELSLSGKGYAEFADQVTFEQGTKYQVEISYVEAPESDPVVVTYNVDGAYVAPVIAGVSLSYNKVESDLNSHSEVSIETADELIVRFGKPVDVIGAMYAINPMKMVETEEGTVWVADESTDIAVGEMSINAIGAVQFEAPINFEQGKKFQVKVTAFGGTMEDPTELGTATYVFNGAYTEEEPVIAYGTNLDFEDGNVGDVNIATYAKDGTPNQMQEVPGWTMAVENGDARAAGVVAYGSKTTLGGATYGVPAEGPEATNGNALAMVGVWTGTVQYTQDVELEPGLYSMTVPVYNTAGTTAFVKNLIGVIIDGEETFATTKSYAVGSWKNEVVSFELAEKKTVTLSVGYAGANVGSGASQHLFLDRVELQKVDELDLAKAEAFAKVPAASESIFGYDEETVTGWTLAISNATTVEEVEAVVASIESTPVQAVLNTYTIYNVTAENYLGEAVLSAEPVEVTFEKANGGYYIKMGDNYVNMKGTDNWSMNVGAEPTTAWNFNFVDGVYTISGPKGMIGTDATAAGSATYGDKNAAKNGTWVIEAVPSTEIAVYPALVVGEEEIALNEHSAVSAETADAISVAFENVVPVTASYKLSSMLLVAGEESSSWELNETIAEGELSINGKAFGEFEEPVLFEQGTKYQLDITYAPMEGEATTVSYLIDGAYAAPLIAAVDFINGEEVYTVNNHSTVAIPASESIKVTFGNAVDVATATYAIMPMYQAETEEGTTWVPSMPNAEFGELSINTYGYAELAKTYEQGTKYQLDIKVTYLDGSDYTESFQFDGATPGDEPTEPEIAVTYYEQGPVIDVIFTNQKDVAPTYTVDILLDGVKANVELGQEWNELYVYASEKLAAGEHTLVFPVGSLIFDSNNDNTEEYTVTFTVEGPQESILGEPEIAIADDVLTITFDAPEGVEGASLASAGIMITKGETQYYGNADEAYAENGKIVVTVPLASTMDMNTFSPYEPTEGDELTIAIMEPEVYANYADGSFEKVWAGDDIVANYTVAAGEPTPVIAAGDYLFKNVESGRYLNGANSWGTKASATLHGQFMTIAALEDGTYTIDSHFSNGGDKHFVGAGDNLYVDGLPVGHTFEQVAEGVWAIKDSNGKYLAANAENLVNFDATEITEAAQWVLVTKEDVLASAEEATAEAPVDMTALIADANFSRNNTDISKWEGDVPAKGGENTNTNAEKWGGNSETFDSHQTLTNLPNGIYKLSAQGYYRYNNTTENTNDVAAAAHADGTEVINSYLYANDVEVALASIADEAAVEAYGKMPFLQSDASVAFALGVYTNELTVEVTDGTLTLGVKKTDHPGTDWTVWDNFELYYLGEPVPALVENELTPAANALDGMMVVITDKSATYSIVGSHSEADRAPGKGEQDLYSINLNDYTAAQNAYVKFDKVTNASVAGDNLYTMQLANANGTNYEIWGGYGQGYINFQPEGDIIFAIGLNGQYGQDGTNCGLWEVTAVAGGYTIKNVGNGKYYDPTQSVPSAEPVVVKFFENIADEANAIDTIEIATKSNGKYIENGKVVIVRNGVKYNMNGMMIK